MKKERTYDRAYCLVNWRDTSSTNGWYDSSDLWRGKGINAYASAKVAQRAADKLNANGAQVVVRHRDMIRKPEAGGSMNRNPERAERKLKPSTLIREILKACAVDGWDIVGAVGYGESDLEKMSGVAEVIEYTKQVEDAKVYLQRGRHTRGWIRILWQGPDTIQTWDDAWDQVPDWTTNLTSVDRVMDPEAAAAEEKYAPVLAAMEAAGFDRSYIVSDGVRVQCSQCASAGINGIPTHELGCPNDARVRRERDAEEYNDEYGGGDE